MNKINQRFNAFFQRLLTYFIRGVLITIPLFATVFIIVLSFEKLDSLLEIKYPGIGILIILGGIVLIGLIGSSLLVKPVIDLFENLMERAPGVKIIYTFFKEFLEAFVGEKRRFNKPVLVKMSSEGIYRMGFVTKETMVEIDKPGHCAVYMPFSYTFSGEMFIVETDKVKVIDRNATDMMKFVASGGVTHL